MEGGSEYRHVVGAVDAHPRKEEAGGGMRQRGAASGRFRCGIRRQVRFPMSSHPTRTSVFGGMKEVSGYRSRIRASRRVR